MRLLDLFRTRGYTPNFPLDATKYLDGSGAFSTPAGSSGSILGAISGIELAYNSGTVLRVKAGTATVDGVAVSFSQTDYTSGSTMKNIANSTVTLAANKHYWVFLSSGGVIGFEENDGTGDGATPVFDTALDYWKAASTGVAWRRLGSFWTNGIAEVCAFYVSSLGRIRRTFITGTATCQQLVGAGASPSGFTSLTITPWYTADMAEMLLLVVAVNVGANAASAGVLLSMDAGASAFAFPFSTLSITGASAIQTTYQQVFMPYTGTLHYQTTGSSSNDTTTEIDALGFTQFV